MSIGGTNCDVFALCLTSETLSVLRCRLLSVSGISAVTQKGLACDTNLIYEGIVPQKGTHTRTG